MTLSHFIIAAILVGLSPLGLVADGADTKKSVGVLRVVDSQGNSVILKKTTGELAELQVGSSATITIDGKPANLQGLKSGLKVVGLDLAGDGSIRSLRVETEPVKLRIVISKDGECRVIVGRAIPEVEGRRGPGVVPISTWYSARPASGADDPKHGSLVGQLGDPKKPGGMLVYPRALRLPCEITADITELWDARLGIQLVTSTINFVIGITTDDGLRESASLRVSCSSRARGAEGSYNQSPVTIESRVRLDQPEELRFQVPLRADQLNELMALDFVLDAVKREGVSPSALITKVQIVGDNSRTLGMDLGVKQGKIVVERVDPSGIAATAGIKAGDVVAALDGHNLPLLKDARELVLTFDFATKPTADLTIVRGRTKKDVTLRFE